MEGTMYDRASGNQLASQVRGIDEICVSVVSLANYHSNEDVMRDSSNHPGTVEHDQLQHSSDKFHADHNRSKQHNQRYVPRPSAFRGTVMSVEQEYAGTFPECSTPTAGHPRTSSFSSAGYMTPISPINQAHTDYFDDSNLPQDKCPNEYAVPTFPPTQNSEILYHNTRDLLPDSGVYENTDSTKQSEYHNIKIY